ncbi:J domain-containing protein [Tundrisphaera lichenicola]|uniref:J domain-containing protein n=1 Tax=Tundrisphaera lichenicola TaxID=2029860 RepID=UPI003EBD2739
MSHSFQFDPNTILGVPPGASLGEIRDAYRQKSLKHHPDKGGDEWAFRMVSRAYEILSNARVVNRASYDAPPPSPAPPPHRATWTQGFSPSDPNPAGGGPDPMSNVQGWSAPRHSHAGEDPARVARFVLAELLILRFELEASLDLFTRSPEERNLSCTLHVSWPLDELAERASKIPDAAKFHKRIGEALKAKGVRKNALNKRSHIENNRLDAWFTYPTAVMASEALEALRAALAPHELEVEKVVREMSVPRKWS